MNTFKIDVREAIITTTNSSNVIALSFEAYTEDVAALLTVEDVISCFSVEEILDAINIDDVKAHFLICE